MGLTSKDPARMLISPPPEEELRLARTPKGGAQPKRKRQQTLPNQLTPNPKPRKQVRNERTPSPTRNRSPNKLILHQSPHLNNPNADYLPPAPAHASRRRSATPVLVPYEPPKVVFTPPREVIITPNVQTPRRRAAKANPKPIVVKAEPPVIDLSEPMPPPSPTDDPLLLTGPSPQQHAFPPSTPTRQSSSPHNDGWGTSTDSMDVETRPLIDVLFPNAGTSVQVVFGLTLMRGEGEYTGKWMMKLVPTKQDPPSSATRARMDSWGRPVSPHPFRRRFSRVEEDSEEEDGPIQQEEETEMAVEDGNNEIPIADYDDEDDDPGVQPPHDTDGQPDVPQDVAASMNCDDELESPQPTTEVAEVSDSSMPVDSQNPSAETNDISVDQEEVALDKDASAPVPFPSLNHADSDDEAEEEEVRAMSVEREDAPSPQLYPSLHSHYLAAPLLNVSPVPEQVQAQVATRMDDDEGESDSEEVDFNLVKISSKDPHAAATVAAILKQYNYDCYTKTKLRENQRRRKTIDGGIQKRNAFATPARQRPRSIGGDKVMFPGSPAITLDCLLEQVEVEVKSAKQPVEHKKRLEIAQGGGAWSKEEWKTLDMCFTEERYQVGGGDVMAHVDDVDIANVVARFEELVPCGEWTKDDLEGRTLAIGNRQRSGKVAPPLTPRGVSRRAVDSNTETPLAARGRKASMEIPDFTPLGRRAMPPARAKKTPAPSFRLPEATPEGAPFQNLFAKKPSLLHAPRYSHLLDEAHAISAGRPKVAPPQPEHVPEEDEEEEEEEEEEEGDESVDKSTETDQSEDTSMEDSFDQSLEEESIAPLQTPAALPKRPPPRTSLGNRVKGFLFSYLPSGTKTAPVNKRQAPRPNQLPLPPLELLAKERGPINTPVKAPGPKTKAPKELVDLQHVQEPKPKSMIPRKVQPKRLVDLTHISPEKEKQRAAEARPRRSSGASVKDMVKGFEDLQKSQSQAPEVKRTKSSGDLRKKNGASSSGRPVWR
ncbi:hypothetical protein BDZ89DRAFT_1033304 [Hymenopellis radicata]|nr:hypothetical protein BDZ89DRAFT_1033304 [Hymenopellis radicata]